MSVLDVYHVLQPSESKKPLAASSKKAAAAEAAAAAAKDAKKANGDPEVVPAETKVCCGTMGSVNTPLSLQEICAVILPAWSPTCCCCSTCFCPEAQLRCTGCLTQLAAENATDWIIAMHTVALP